MTTVAADGSAVVIDTAADAGKTEEKSKDFLGMSDEDFLKINAPGDEAVTTATTESSASAAAGDEGKEKKTGEEAKPGEGAPATDNQAAADDAGKAKDTKQEEKKDDTSVAAGKVADGAVASGPGSNDKAQGATDTKVADKAAAAVTPDYKGFFEQVMKPFKANGKTIELKTPEEAIRLMQQGAGFGRKIQDMQPHLKTIRMLEKAELLDPEKLSFLIDINNKNPDAIKKLIKDSGIDPLDLNTGDNVSYSPTNHAVSDKEMAFQSALEDVKSAPGGLETLTHVNQKWDPQSKSALWDSPELLRVIQSQRETGVYDQIDAEIDRQKMLGMIPHNAPFLTAYKLAGDHLVTTKGFKAPAAGTTSDAGPGVTPTPLATRVEAPKATVSNGDQAAAAAATKTVVSKGAKVTVNPLNMPDDEFLKQFAGRL